MAVPSTIKDGQGGGTFAKVTSRGQLVTSPLEFSDPIFQSLNSDDTAENFFKPIPGKRLVITDLIVQTDRNVVTTGVIVDIFETDSVSSNTVDKQLFQFDMTRQGLVTLNSLNLIITEGVWINAKASDSNVLITISGYFVDV